MAISISIFPHLKNITFGKAFLLAGLLAGTLDIVSAILLHTVLSGAFRPVGLLQGIASGAFGKSAMEGGAPMAIAGLFFHYIIAYSWVLIYFILFPRISLMRKHRILSGLFYGVLIWVIMNRVVVPLSEIKPGPFRWDRALMNLVILMVMVGLPASLFSHWYYTRASLRADKVKKI
ncbi:MAG: hypothetical protein WC756_19810 [Taibaiella sp.]|jgi:hypothetical protein